MLERKLLPLLAMVLALGLSGLTTHVKAADTTYGNGNGAVVTVPKKMQGTWYSYDSNAHSGRKITFTAHTVNGKIIYTQDKSIISDYFNGNIQDQAGFDRATKNWMSGQTTKMKNNLFYEINPWISFENWSLYRVMPLTI
ncbi:hypothetical protein [Lactobacillus helveticus]|jgi:hypothetical protein|uniref:Surface layer protein A domain-containing protein n=2 Tax=Lactobacillus helveticus TaxID=1587 RepID=A0A2X0T3V9_LACHE|nr:hypothetical protein [Lactobacillus helveticus]ADX70053.1 Conserved protein [Lactobacillus helveticus H10]AGQ23728.1 hypothetical protein lhe_1245 [Lactobacillus helveticus CNRZ32]NRN72695.1 hypothetical protein [Lactobacillus helveticus]NRN74988.1 hypothetical protein [Lactobacillus helveticus]NRN77022.1 hypothetical protein [Lactobacillus helveticus]